MRNDNSKVMGMGEDGVKGCGFLRPGPIGLQCHTNQVLENNKEVLMTLQCLLEKFSQFSQLFSSLCEFEIFFNVFKIFL